MLRGSRQLNLGGRRRDLAAQFADAGLLDEVIVYIAPVFLGAGAPLFPRRQELELVALAQNVEIACARYTVVAS